jgi:hypothetical protein
MTNTIALMIRGGRGGVRERRGEEGEKERRERRGEKGEKREQTRINSNINGTFLNTIRKWFNKIKTLIWTTIKEIIFIIMIFLYLCMCCVLCVVWRVC